MIKKFTKKSLALILCATVLLSCMVFAMPAANAATSTSYKARIEINCTNGFTGDNMTLTVKGKDHNGTGETAAQIDSLSSTEISTASNTIFDKEGTMYYPSESGVSLSKVFPTSLTSSVKKSSGWVITYGAYTTTIQIYDYKNSKWVDLCSNASGNFRTDGSTSCSCEESVYPATTYPDHIAMSPSKVTLDGINNKTATVKAYDKNGNVMSATLYDQYGVEFERSITYTTPVYNADKFSISGTTISINKEAHIGGSADLEGMNQQSFTVKANWAGLSSFNCLLTIEDEKYTATYKWFESNEANPASPTIKTQNVTGIYYGDYPTDEQVPEAIDHYYNDTQHFTNGQFPSIPTNNTYVMAYTAASHTMLTTVEDEATCQGPGSTRHYCNCGYHYIEEGTPAQVDHDYVPMVVEPTCTEAGYTRNTCRFCGIYYDSDPVEALGHNYRRTSITEASCTEAGSKTYTCRRCGDIYTEEIPATGHDYDSMTIEPTCTTGGYTIYACNNCGDSYTDDITQALGHDYQLTQIPATCTTAGKDTYTCSRCGDSYSNDTPALGHDFSTSAITTPATCTENGVKTYYCSRCDAVQTEEIIATGHDYQKSVVAPTCDKQGYDLYKCSKCQDEYMENYTDALSHIWNDGEITTPVSCTENGVITYTCSRCQGTKEEIIEAPGHSYETKIVDPTCTEKGYTEFSCERCGDTYKDNYVDELGHNFSTNSVTKEPKCTEDGVRTYYCSRCDATKDETIEKLGHNYITTVVAPTCTEQGYTEYNCSRCQDTYIDNYVDDLGGHLFTEYFYNEDATCTEDGTETATCDRCDATDTRTAVGTMLGHDFGEWTTVDPPTCIQDGYEQRVCSRCRAEENNPLPALGHDKVYKDVPATCTEGAYTETTCTRCDYYVKDVTSEPLGHDFGAWKVTTKPGCESEGEQTRYCSRCDAFETEPVSALGHIWTQVVDNPENETNGYIYYQCDNCGKYRNAVLSGDNTAVLGDDIFEDIALVKADTLEISAPTFNRYYNTEQQYDYSTRGAALRYTDPTYIDDYTTQDTRFTASLFIPSNIDISFSGTSGDRVTDFGFVFAQTGFIDDTNELKLGNDTYSISVPARNAGKGNISDWSGVTVHDDSFGGSTLTFNLLLKIKAKNWNKDYCARAYVTYTQNGFTYTVYDNDYASRSVADIARAVVESDTETQEAKDYCQTKILDNLDIA